MSNLIAATSTGKEIGNPVLGPALQGFAKSEGGGAFFTTIIANIITFMFVAGSLIFFFMLATGAIQWITSGGDKQALEGARGKITNAVIGIVLLFASYAIIGLIGNFFGVDILTLDIGPLKI